MNFKNLVAAVAVMTIATSAFAQRYGCNIKFTNMSGKTAQVEPVYDAGGDMDIVTLSPGAVKATTVNNMFAGNEFIVNIGNGEYFYHVRIDACQPGGQEIHLNILPTDVKEVGTNALTIGLHGANGDCPACPGRCPSCPARY